MVKAPKDFHAEEVAMKKFVVCILTLLVMAPLAPLAASAETFITNTTQVLPYIGSGYYAGPSAWTDNIPSGDSLFKIYGYSIGYSNPSRTDVRLNIYTNMSQGGDPDTNLPIACPVGDLFLNLDGTGFTQVVKLPASNGVGTLLNVTSSQTSQDVWSGISGWYYGGEYRDIQISPTISGIPLVKAEGNATNLYGADGTPFADNITITATWDENHTTNPGDYILSILLPGLDGNDGNHLKFLWSSGTCGNGTIYADVDLTEVSPPQVPVPPSALLLGTGLLGLVFLRKRRVER